MTFYTPKVGDRVIDKGSGKTGTVLSVTKDAADVMFDRTGPHTMTALLRTDRLEPLSTGMIR